MALAFEAPAGEVVVIFNEGLSTELRVTNDAGGLRLLQVEPVRRHGNEAQKCNIVLLDETASAWKLARFGSSVKVVIHGAAEWSGSVVTRSYDRLGVAVLVTLQCVGRSQLLFTETVTTEQTWTNQKTGLIVKELVDAYFAGRIDTSLVDTTAGATVEEFTALPGDIVGDLIEDLRKQDGYSYEVDESDRLHYFLPDATPQATFTEDDIALDPGASPIEEGVVPPRNVVRVLGGSGYAMRTRQEVQDAYRNVDSANVRVAQRFQAMTDRLSAVQLHLDRTLEPNKPASLRIEICEDGTGTPTTLAQSTGGATGERINSTTRRLAEVRTFPSPGTPLIRVTQFIFGNFGITGSPSLRLGVYEVDGSNKPTGAALWEEAYAGGSTHNPTSPLILNAGLKHAVVLSATSADGSNYYDWRDGAAIVGANSWESNDGGLTWDAADLAGAPFHLRYTTAPVQPGGLVEWGDDHSLGAGDHAYPPSAGGDAWAAIKSWTKPKLALTKGHWYWIRTRDPSATGSAYWRHGYATTGSTLTQEGEHAIVSTDGGTTYANLGQDLAFRLYWSQNDVDVTRTRARAKLTAPAGAGATSLAVDELQDYATLPTTLKIGTDEVTATARSATSGPGTLTVTALPNAHVTGEWVTAYSIRQYGVWPYETKAQDLASLEEANSVALSILDAHEAPKTRTTVRLNRIVTGLHPRSVVRLTRPHLDHDESHEVEEVRHTLSPEERPHTTLTLGAREYNAARALEELRQGVD